MSCSSPEDIFSSEMILLSKEVVGPAQLFPCMKVTRA